MSHYQTRSDSQAVDTVVSSFLDATNYGTGTPERLDQMLRDALHLNLNPKDHAIVLSHAADGAMNKYSFGEPDQARAVIDTHLKAWADKAVRYQTVPTHFIPAAMFAFALLRRGPEESFIAYAQKMALSQMNRFADREMRDMLTGMSKLALPFDARFRDALATRIPAATRKLSGEDLFHVLYDMAIIDAVASVGVKEYRPAFKSTFERMTEDKAILDKLRDAHSISNLQMLRDACYWYTGRRIKFNGDRDEPTSALEFKVMEHFQRVGGDILSQVKCPDTGHNIDVAVSFNAKVGLTECDGEKYHFNRFPGGIIRLDGSSIFQTLLHARAIFKPIIRLPETFVSAQGAEGEGWTQLAAAIRDAKPGAYIVTPEGNLDSNLRMDWPLYEEARKHPPSPP